MYQLRYCLLAIIMASMLLGCAPGRTSSLQPAVASSSKATLKMSEKYLGILMIDDVKSMSASEFTFSGGTGFPRTYIVTPGKHTVLAIFGKGVKMNLWIVAEAGKEYLLKINCSSRGSSRMWFEDTSNGRTVGGVVGSDDEPKKQH
jgi:hypothetical protein